MKIEEMIYQSPETEVIELCIEAPVAYSPNGDPIEDDDTEYDW